jgi:hypothetical protein
MTGNSLSSMGGINGNQKNLSPEEQAVLEGARTPILRDIFTRIWRIKLRLQFTGWLQYIPFALSALAFFIIAAFAHLLGIVRAAGAFALIGTLLLVILIFDLVTVKFRIRFHERLPKRNDDLGMFDLMRARRSCRSFQTRKLRPADYNELMEYVRLHSSSPTIGKSPVRFEYISAPLSVWPTVNATEFLVAIAPSQYDRLAVIDVGRSLQKIVMDATRMGLGTCWIGPGADQTSIARDLGARFDPQKDHIICVCAIGYKSCYIPMFLRIFNLQFHRRLPLSSLFFADSHFKQPLNVEAYPFNRFGRTYEICQWSPSSYNGQTTRCAAGLEPNGAQKVEHGEGDPRLARFDFYAATDSRYFAAVAVGIWCANWEMGCEALGIEGHIAVLSAEQRGVQDGETCPQLPRYDLSWVLDESL